MAAKTYETDDTLAGQGRWRVYFNRHGTLREAFSVDRGHGLPRRHFGIVRIQSIPAARFVANGRKPDGVNPVAWIEVRGCLNAIWSRRQRAHAAVIVGMAPNGKVQKKTSR
jgi:hypothetical protein